MIAPEHRASFAQHAAPEAIEHQLRQAKAARRQAQRDIEWLAELAGRRAAEMAAGVWPSSGDAPAACSISSERAEIISGVPASTPDGSEPAKNECDCGHDGLPAEWHSRPCPIAEARVAGCLVPPSVGLGCICHGVVL